MSITTLTESDISKFKGSNKGRCHLRYVGDLSQATSLIFYLFSALTSRFRILTGSTPPVMIPVIAVFCFSESLQPERVIFPTIESTRLFKSFTLITY